MFAGHLRMENCSGKRTSKTQEEKSRTWGHSCSPLVYQDKVIVQGGGDALVIAYDKMKGDIIWKSMQGKAGYAAVTSMKIEDANEILVFHGTGLSMP